MILIYQQIIGQTTTPKGEKTQEFLDFTKDLLILFAKIYGLSALLIMLAFRKEIRESAIRHRKLIRAITLIVIAAIYLNIGWASGTYSVMYLREGMAQTTILQKFLVGPNKIFAPGPNPVLLWSQVVYMFFWLFWLAGLVLAWIMWLLVAVAAWILLLVLWLFCGLWQIAVFIFRLIFAGGIAKLLGVG